MNGINETVINAINTTKMVDKKYYIATLSQRCDTEGAAGSVIDGICSVEEMETLLTNAEWEEYNHPDIMENCKGFKAPIPGKMGVIKLESLPDDAVGVLDDRKDTGMVSITVSVGYRVPVDYTILIIGPENIGGEEVQLMYTFHPGDPISPSRVPASEKYKHGLQITIKEARELGLVYAKIV